MRPSGHTRYFTETSGDRLIADAIALEETMWPAIDRVIASHATIGAPNVLDWWLFSPERVAALDGDIASIWLHVDPDTLEERERTLNADFFAQSSDPEQMLAHFMRRSLWRNQLVASQARDLGMPVLHQSGAETVDDLIAAALGMIDGRGAPLGVPSTER